MEKYYKRLIMNKNLYILAELDEGTQKKLKLYEKIILENGLTGKQTKDIPYHITLNSYPLELENSLMDLLDKIEASYKQIDVVYSGFGLFGLNVLYLNPIMNMELLDLFNFTKENNHSESDGFAAHTTLLLDEPENVLKLLPQFVEKSSSTSGKIKYISLYEFFPTRLIKRIELKEE